MMYIEHTPLEDNLQDIIRRSTLLAHVHADANNDDDEARHTHSQLHFGVPERIAFANYRAAIGGENLHAAAARNHLQVAGVAAAAAVTGAALTAAATVNGLECDAVKYLKYNNLHDNNIQIYNNNCNHNGTTIKSTKQKLSPRPPPPPPPPLLPTSKLCANAKEEEGNEEEEYELIDVFDQEFNEEQSVKSTNLKETKRVKRVEKSVNCNAKVLICEEEEEEQEVEEEEEALPNEITFQIETGGDQVEYILTRKSNRKPNFEQTEAPPKEDQSSRKRTPRPIPAAIPIDSVFYGAPRRGRLLNLSLPAVNVNGDVFDDDDDDVPSTSNWQRQQRRQEPNSHRYAGEQTRWVVRNDDTPIQVVDTQEHDSSMGILTKIRQLLNLQGNNNLETEDRSRKRRLEAQNSNSNNSLPPHQFKYRKVTDNFPELITHTVEDDDLDLISAYPTNRISRHNSFARPDNFAIMAERKNFNSMSAPKMRKSIFAVPETTNKLVKNTSYADIEFSDDDELELVKGFGIDFDSDNGNASGGGGGGGSGNSLRKVGASAYNIPVRHYRTEELPARTKYASKLPPPPLIEACNTCNRSVPSMMMPQMELTRRPILQDSFRQQQQQQSSRATNVMGNLMNQPLGSLASSSGDSIFGPLAGGYKSFNKNRMNPWSTNAHSILAQEKETEEREKYRQLLEQVVPRLYGNENSQVHLPKALKSIREFDTTRQNGFFGDTASSLSFMGASARKGGVMPTRKSLHHPGLKKPPLSSTINLTDEDEEEEQLVEEEEDDDNDVTVTGVTRLKKQRTPKDVTMTVIIDDDDEDEDDVDDISEIIDLDEDERNMIAACNKLKSPIAADKAKQKHKTIENKLPYVEPVNTLQDRFKSSPHLNDNWLQKWQLEWKQKRKARLKEVDEAAKLAEKLSVERRTAESEIRERLKNFQIIDPDLVIIDDFPEPVEEPEFVALTPEHQARIKAAICGPTDQVLITKFNLNITRRDIHTLLGHNWLNDEVINFYMNLLTERGDTRHDSHGMPLVYAMNTFFVPRLMQAGHGGVKRWTRKVDIFAKDIIPVPVHVGGVHWCMAIIHMKNRTIKYYDSMGTPNPNVLRALEQYLRDESLDKRKQTFDTSQFVIESVQDVPRQMNGSDCGVFSCMFAEYITRNREITFSQQNMEYFRHKMILEIVQGELLH